MLNTIKTLRSALFAALFALAPQAARASDEAPAISCAQEFTAGVYVGPSAGTEVRGLLVLESQEDGGLDGVLQTADGDIELDASIDQDGLHLTFFLPGGGEIHGVDPTTTEFSECPGVLVGDLVGPLPGDAGDWAGETVVTGPNGTTYTSTTDGGGNVIKIVVRTKDGNETSICKVSLDYKPCT